MTILERVKELGLPAEEFVVMGSAILEVKGIRNAEDIDIIVTRQLFEKEKLNPRWEYKVEHGDVGNVQVEMLDDNNGITLYPYIYGGGEIDFFLDDPKRTEQVEGINFASLANLLEVKSSSWNRPKDRLDVELIKAYLSSR
jgi:hypothetical protein